MYKKLTTLFFVFLTSFAHAEITKTTDIDSIRAHLNEKNALYLFDIDETLITNPYCLGSHAWRKWVKPKIKSNSTDLNLYDEMALHLVKNLPHKTVESGTAALIADLQEQGAAVFALTARGRSKWYSSQIVGIDKLTALQLEFLGIDFSKTEMFSEGETLDNDYFYKGIIFTGDEKKGPLLKQFLNDVNFQPSCIVFVDDKLDQVKSVEAAAKAANIPFYGYWYIRMENEWVDFNPLVALVQLEHLVIKDEVLSNEEAYKAAKELKQTDPEVYFNNIVDQLEEYLFAPYNKS